MINYFIQLEVNLKMNEVTHHFKYDINIYNDVLLNLAQLF